MTPERDPLPVISPAVLAEVIVVIVVFAAIVLNATTITDVLVAMHHW